MVNYNTNILSLQEKNAIKFVNFSIGEKFYHMIGFFISNPINIYSHIISNFIANIYYYNLTIIVVLAFLNQLWAPYIHALGIYI